MNSLVGTRRSNGDLLLRTISRKRVIFRPINMDNETCQAFCTYCCAVFWNTRSAKQAREMLHGLLSFHHRSTIIAMGTLHCHPIVIVSTIINLGLHGPLSHFTPLSLFVTVW